MKIVTSLSFRGECREAFEFYARVLGGEITVANGETGGAIFTVTLPVRDESEAVG